MVAAPLVLTACGTQDEGVAESRFTAKSAAAAEGEPVGPRNTDVPEAGDYGFGAPAATAHNGEVVAYVPRLDRSRVVVPLTMHNTGEKRASYTVTVTADRGERGAPVTVTKKALNVSSGTTWPAQADITAPGVWVPEDTKISLTVTKDDYPLGDSR
ncbi:hypothetical protein [Streptomyces sp. NPDC048825]|uniref:hypothetical protein n=1 Tax=Streptomyces sp. NPDC048825 TaxID=3365592 RepID=UPI00371699D0